MEVSFENLSSVQSSLEESVNQVKTSYESGEWDDPVHDSYQGYVEQSQNGINSICESVAAILSLQEDCNAIDIDAIKDEFEQIKSEADAF